MRPLAILILILGALAALIFALSSTTDRGIREQPMTVAKPEAPEGGPVDMVEPNLPAAPTTQPKVEETRQALETRGIEGGSTVKFGAIEGKVVDESGVPVAEAEVSLLNFKNSGLGEDLWMMKGVDPPRPVAKVKTEAQGTFRFDRLDPRKDWSLAVTHERYARWDSDSVIPVPEDGTWNEVIALQAGQTCSGTVRDALTQAPIAGATLTVDSPLAPVNKKGSPSRLITQTDANGYYVFNNTGVQSVAQARNLTIQAPGYATQVHMNFTMVTFSEPPTRFKNRQPEGKVESRTQDFELHPGKVIAGRVVGPDNRGMSGIQIEALSQSGTIGSQGYGKSGKNGEFLIEGLAEGIYTVRAEASGYDTSPAQRVEAGETNLTLTLYEQATVTGKVLDPSGAPIAAFTVQARAANDVSDAYGAVLGQKKVRGSGDGSFELHGVPEGTYKIEANADGYASSFSEAFTATQGLVTSDVIVRMSKGGSLYGVVLDSYGGTPVAGAEVVTRENNWVDGDFFELFSALEPSAMTKSSVRTNAEGHFEIEVLTPGEYQVVVKAKGYSQAIVNDVVIVEGQRTELPAQTLVKGATITGIVYGPNGRVAPGSSVQLSPVDTSQTYGYRTIRADSMGRFRLDSALPGTYDLSATRPQSAAGGNPFESIGDMQESKIEITIEDGGQYEFDLHMGGPR